VGGRTWREVADSVTAAAASRALLLLHHRPRRRNPGRSRAPQP